MRRAASGRMSDFNLADNVFNRASGSDRFSRRRILAAELSAASSSTENPARLLTMAERMRQRLGSSPGFACSS